MRLAFIGGCGHHYLRGVAADPGLAVRRPIPVAGDGTDNERARAFAAALGETRWFDDAVQMLDETQPEVISIGAVYAENAKFIIAALERGIVVVSDKPIAAAWEDLARIYWQNIRPIAPSACSQE